MGALAAGSFFLIGGDVRAFLILLGIYAAVIAILLIFCLYKPAKNKWDPLILWNQQTGDDGYKAMADLSELVDARAVAITPLRPAGTVLWKGTRLDVSSLGDYIDKGAKVRVVRVEGSKIFVQEDKGADTHV